MGAGMREAEKLAARRPTTILPETEGTKIVPEKRYLKDLIPILRERRDAWARHEGVAKYEGTNAVVFWSVRRGLQWRDTADDVKVRFGEILDREWVLGFDVPDGVGTE